MRKATKFQSQSTEIRRSGVGAAVLRLLGDGIAARAAAVGPLVRPGVPSGRGQGS